MNRLSNMPNIGKVLEEKLIKVGINSPNELKTAGSRQAFEKIKLVDKEACFNTLCALEGAIQGIRWHYLTDEVKHDLKEFFNVYK